MQIKKMKRKERTEKKRRRRKKEKEGESKEGVGQEECWRIHSHMNATLASTSSAVLLCAPMRRERDSRNKAVSDA